MSSRTNLCNTKYIYITDPLLETVKDSQVINWIQLLDEKKIHFDLIIPTTLYYLIFRNSLRIEKIRKSKKKIKGKIIQLPIIKRRDKTGISIFLLKSYLAILIITYHFNYRNIIIQTRNFNFVPVLKILKKISNKIKIIYDMRGAAAEEYLNSQGYATDENITDIVVQKKYTTILNEQTEMISISDKIVCVSDKLRDYLINLDNRKRINDTLIIPGAADQRIFFFNQLLREHERNTLNIREKCVLIYSGKLDRPWHKSDFIFKVVASLLKTNLKIYFLCLTPDIKIANSLIQKYQIDRRNIFLQYEQYENLNKYYNAADIGLMIRDDIPTNNVASPTKLPEYLLSGLPVFISKNLGDYSDFIKKHNLGFVIENDLDLIVELLIREKISSFDRKKICNIASTHLSKQAKIHDLVNIYSELQ